MNEDERWLEAQLDAVRNRVRLLDEVEEKLQEMKRLAEYARDHQDDRAEVTKIQEKLNQLQMEMLALEQEHQKNVH